MKEREVFVIKCNAINCDRIFRNKEELKRHLKESHSRYVVLEVYA